MDDLIFALVWLAVTAPLIVAVYRRDRRIREIARPQNPAIAGAPTMAAILGDQETWLALLRGKVRAVYSVSAPQFGGGRYADDVRPCYRSFLVDVHGEAHDLEASESFARIDENARWLAEALGVRYDASA